MSSIPLLAHLLLACRMGLWGPGVPRTRVGPPINCRRDVRIGKVYSTTYAFAAVLKEGSVVTWGSWQDSNKLQVTLKGVVKIYSQTTNLVKSRRLRLRDLG